MDKYDKMYTAKLIYLYYPVYMVMMNDDEIDWEPINMVAGYRGCTVCGRKGEWMIGLTVVQHLI